MTPEHKLMGAIPLVTGMAAVNSKTAKSILCCDEKDLSYDGWTLYRTVRKLDPDRDIPGITKMESGLVRAPEERSLIQCAAVRTWRSEIRLPPHRLLPPPVENQNGQTNDSVFFEDCFT